MPIFETKNFGTISYEQESVLEFSHGLPGFEEQRRFLALNYDDTKPLVFLQNLEDGDLCFITLPALSVEPEYRLQVSDEDLEELGFKPGYQPSLGRDVACLIVISLQEEGPTANLLAPIVVNLTNLKAVQAITIESGYSHQQRLLPPEIVACS